MDISTNSRDWELETRLSRTKSSKIHSDKKKKSMKKTNFFDHELCGLEACTIACLVSRIPRADLDK